MNKDEYGDFVLRYKGCGACFPMYHTLSRFEKMWFTAIQKDVAELQKENARLKEINTHTLSQLNLDNGELIIENEKLKKENAELKKKCYKKAVKDYCELEKENAELKLKLEALEGQTPWKDIKDKSELIKENAELKEELQKWKDEWQEQVQKATDEGYARTLQTMQLSKAKEIIKTFLAIVNNDVEYVQNPQDCKDLWKELCENAEQFIKDSDIKEG